MLLVCENGHVAIPSYIWSTSMHMQNLIKFYRFVRKILSGNKILTLTKGHKCLVNLGIWTRNNTILELVKINAYANLDQMPSIRSQDI